MCVHSRSSCSSGFSTKKKAKNRSSNTRRDCVGLYTGQPRCRHLRIGNGQHSRCPSPDWTVVCVCGRRSLAQLARCTCYMNCWSQKSGKRRTPNNVSTSQQYIPPADVAIFIDGGVTSERDDALGQQPTTFISNNPPGVV